MNPNDYTDEQKERARAVNASLLSRGMTQHDAATVTLFTMLMFPDTPLEQLNVFADGPLMEESE